MTDTSARSARSPAVRSPEKRSILSEHAQQCRESLAQLARTPLATGLNCLVIGIALALPAFLLVVLADIQKVIAHLDKEPRITLYLEDGLGNPETLTLLEQIRQRTAVKQARLITPEQALEQLKGFLPDADEAIRLLGHNPLPATLIVTPADTLQTPDAIRQLHDQLKALPGIHRSEVDIDWVRRLFAFSDLIHHMALLLGVLLSVAVLLVIGNTIRLLIDGRAEEIAVIKLVGGTDTFIRRPLLYSGFWIGLGGGIVAVGLTVMAITWLNEPVQSIARLYRSDFGISLPGISTCLLIFLASAGLGWAGARLATDRQIRQIEP